MTDRKRRTRTGRHSTHTARATMLEVAALAGVSSQTVSRVIGRPDLVAEPTRLRVQQAIAKLNYIPNGAARNLASNSSRMVAVVIPTLASSAYSSQVNSMIEVLETRGISILIGNSEYSLDREEQLVRSLLERRPQGFILTGLQHNDRTRDLLVDSGVPVVETWDIDGEPIDHAVGFSNVFAGAEVGRLFAARGVRQAAFVGGRAELDFRAELRFRGLASALEAAGLPPPLRVSRDMPMHEVDGVLGLDEVLSRAPLTDAILFSADGQALAALMECARRGIRVPEQLAICGFGDYELARFVSPALTTVRIQPEVMGRRAAEVLLSIIDGDDPEHVLNITPQLIRRGSC